MWENGEMVYLVVGRDEVYQCSPDMAFNWVAAGYHLYGAADTNEEVEWLYRDAQGYEPEWDI